MRYLLIILSIFFTACNYTATEDTINAQPATDSLVEVKLVDSLGSVTLTIPKRYDTLFSWTQQSDCGKPCNKIKYRFQPRSLRITKESGFLWLGEPKDSIDRFTISHSGYFPFHEKADSILIFTYHHHEILNIVQHPDTYKIKKDTVEKIGDRYFSIITIDLYDTAKSQFSKKLLAATSIKSNLLYFTFELLTREKNEITDNFIQTSLDLLRTVRISNNK